MSLSLSLLLSVVVVVVEVMVMMMTMMMIMVVRLFVTSNDMKCHVTHIFFLLCGCACSPLLR